ncbi:MAG: 3-oxoacyl-[acyl-carrier protein] reductase [Verrucomicrobiales bacterium]|jgi:3-oxoacyl-[acyl-carrier protein] reductase
MNLSDYQILLIGGNSGIGKATLAKLTASGAKLTVAARSTADLPIPAQIFDATQPQTPLEIPDSLDAVIYFPGTIKLKPFHRLTAEDFQNDMQVNFFGAVNVIQQALPALKKSASGNASITLFSSVAATTGMPFHASIGSAKAAVEGLTRSLAAEFSPAIRVNAIAPSLTDTPLASQFLSSDSAREAAAKRHPLNRVGDPEQIADLVAFLASDSARFITGQILGVDGGLSSIHKF